jgi:[histone H3]-trimethyl-L-lysine4 demethylase
VEYAADLPSKRYGSAFHTNDSANGDVFDASGHFFNLNHINDSENSLFQYANKFKISGIMSPWVYLGMLFSCFCWHVEDLYMYSINYMHVGNPKTW